MILRRSTINRIFRLEDHPATAQRLSNSRTLVFRASRLPRYDDRTAIG